MHRVRRGYGYSREEQAVIVAILSHGSEGYVCCSVREPRYRYPQQTT
jgi:hypothetical protein